MSGLSGFWDEGRVVDVMRGEVRRTMCRLEGD